MSVQKAASECGKSMSNVASTIGNGAVRFAKWSYHQVEWVAKGIATYAVRAFNWAKTTGGDAYRAAAPVVSQNATAFIKLVTTSPAAAAGFAAAVATAVTACICRRGPQHA